MTAPAPDIDALARATIALGEAATPGPWFRGNGAHWSREVRAGDEDGVAFCGHADFDADAALIAAYRTSAPALAAALLEAREAMREVLAMLGEPLHWHERVEKRTREIGIRMAVGAEPHHILTQFLIEALALKAAARLESALRSGAGQGEGGGG